MSRTVLITGCSTGFGRLMVDAFLRDGWTVLATMRKVSARSGEFEASAKLRLLELDVTRAEDRAAVRSVVEREFHGKLDCLVNNAGYGVFGALEDTSEETLRAQFEVNFFGVALLTRELLPALRRARGRVINLSSVAGIHGMPLTSAYCASKFAIEGLTESLSHELAPHGVQVALIEPGAFRTRFGTNVVWTAQAGERGSAYAGQMANYRALHSKLMSGPGNSPEPVVRTALRLANSARMPLRVRCGKDARALGMMMRLMPGKLFQRLVGAAYNRIFNKGLQLSGRGT